MVRSPEKAADLTARGVGVCQADYSQPETLESAFAAGDKVLLISGSEIGQQPPQHWAVVESRPRGRPASLCSATPAARAGAPRSPGRTISA
ncbi:Rossmann-fold NAD(P)-binding domain-containing protein [Streptomyces gibsoniae]|uniref:hypothetical protein n=1 Tax=Streptomyces gibsoniae TaxID=3075529 RepID=UPI00374E0A99